MKKCPKCGNPSYDGAPVCGNCGYNFPKPKVEVPRREDIFQQVPKMEEDSDNEDTLTILKENKFIIGTIIVITLIVICGIVLVGNMNNQDLPVESDDLIQYNSNDFTFKYPSTWRAINSSDSANPGAVFYQNENNVTIEFYNISSSIPTIQDLSQDRITYAQNHGDYVDFVETITINNAVASNIIIQNADGNYTRYVSMLDNGKAYVFKMTSADANLLESEDITQAINSANIS